MEEMRDDEDVGDVHIFPGEWDEVDVSPPHLGLTF